MLNYQKTFDYSANSNTTEMDIDRNIDTFMCSTVNAFRCKLTKQLLILTDADWQTQMSIRPNADQHDNSIGDPESSWGL